MKSFFQLIEELTPEQKQDVDRWGKNTEATKISQNVFPEGHDRIEIPLEHPVDESTKVEPHPDVEDHLEKNGYKIKDYKFGVATDKHGREVKIGKALEKTKAEDKVKQAFANDPSRAASSQAGNLKVIISKHPHDVAGMSTDRGWTSCMNMKDGANSHYLRHDVQQGTHVAYLVNKDDNDIKKPLARIALKPYENSDDSNHKILRPEESGYGTGDSAFHHTVKQFAEKHYPAKGAIYYKNDKVYDDDGNHIIYNENASDEDLNKSLKGKIATSRAQALKHPNIKLSHVLNALHDPDTVVRVAAARSKLLTPKHLNTVLDDKDPTVRRAAIHNLNIDKSNIDKAINDEDEGVANSASLHPLADDDHLYKMLEKHPMKINDLRGNRVSEELHKRLLKHPEAIVRLMQMKRDQTTPEQLADLAKNDPHEAIRIEAQKDLERDHPEYLEKKEKSKEKSKSETHDKYDNMVRV